MQAILGTQYIGKPEGSNFGSFFMMIQESLMNSARRVYIQVSYPLIMLTMQPMD